MKLVDVDVVVKALDGALEEQTGIIDFLRGQLLVGFTKQVLSDAPAVDAVEVVRCKDCKYGEPNGQYGCKCYHYKLYETHEMSPNDFCSHGERKEDANN